MQHILIREKTCICQTLHICIFWKKISEIITVYENGQTTSRASCEKGLWSWHKQLKNLIFAIKLMLATRCIWFIKDQPSHHFEIWIIRVGRRKCRTYVLSLRCNSKISCKTISKYQTWNGNIETKKTRFLKQKAKIIYMNVS